MNNQFSISSVKKLFVRIYRFAVTKFPIRNYQSLLMFIFFVSLASVLWLLKVLNNDDHTTVINYPVTYVNLPADKVLTNKLPKNLSIRVNGNGFTLLNYMLKPKPKSIRFDVSSFSLNKLPGENEDAFFTLTRYANQKLTDHFNNELEILQISPDTLKFYFSERTSRIVPVRFNAEVETSRLYMIIGSVQFTPDSVQVSGPASVIDTISGIQTQKVVLSEVEDSIRQQVPLQSIPQVIVKPDNVQVQIPVDKYTTKNIQVPIDLLNVPDSLSMKIFPSTVPVSFKVAVSQYDLVTPEDFRITVDYSGIEESISSQLRLKLERYPEYIQSPVLRKKTVEYLIEK